MKKILIISFATICLSFGVAFASGSVSGTLAGVDRYSGTYQLNKSGGGAVTLPTNTVFEDGAVNGTVYTCTYEGSVNAMTSANCAVKTAVVKGNLDGNTIVDINDDTTILANLPASTTFSGGRTDGSIYLCNYTGSLPDVITAKCTLDKVATAPVASVSGYRLFPDLKCANGTQPLSCFTQEVFSFSQVAIVVLAVGAIVVAGVIYMTSAGNPKQIELAKKLIFGALTGIAVMVLGRLFLTKVIGVAWPL